MICITGDHTTPTQSGDHTYEPVPVTVSLLSNVLENNSNSPLAQLKDDVELFDELSCGQGQDALLGRFPSFYLMPTLLKYREKVRSLM